MIKRTISRTEIQCNDIGRGVRTIDSNGRIIRESFLCNECSESFSKEETKKFKKLKGKISTSQMICARCENNLYKSTSKEIKIVEESYGK